MNANLDWMSRPFAHRGLHDTSKGIIENSPSAIRAAIKGGYGIEVDLRPASCGTVMVFHDGSLERLTHATGAVVSKNSDELQEIAFRGTDDKMMTLNDLLQLVDGRIPMLLEIKSNWPLEEKPVREFVSQIVTTLEGYSGQFAVMSFDPSIISIFRSVAPAIPRGLISEQFQNQKDWPQLSLRNRLSLRFLLSAPRTRPDFIAYNLNALPAIGPLVARHIFGRKLLTWTVRTNEQKQRAQKYCDAMIFEGFEPSPDQTGNTL